MSAPLLEVRSLSLDLGGQAILKGISLKLEQGEFLCVVGPNGAAKSTLIKCIDGIYSRYRGGIYWQGQEARSLSRKQVARCVAYVPQGGMDQIPYTVREFMEMARYPWKDLFVPLGAEDRECIDEAFALADIGAYADRKLNTLSGGERQRVLVASALAQGSSLLLLDEPTTYLDYYHQMKVLSLVRRINRERGLAVLSVTHDINFALRAADRILALREGRLVWEGQPREMLEKDCLQDIFGVPFLQFSAPDASIPYVVPRGGDVA